MFLLILDSLGNSELLVILGAALIFFGPRRLPQLSRQIGKSLTEFRRASEDFKRTWEREVNLDDADRGAPPENSIFDRAADRIRAAREAVPGLQSTGTRRLRESRPPLPQLIHRWSSRREGKPQGETAPSDQSNRQSNRQPDRKQDWL